ncbi:23S rRNA (pseudouridine(1915)-N(3))-methyltransferase RlmH [Labilibaculum sp. DW002]|jgi:23S rRNA (pseudouridine1915-N3)-methyltransferase|uniref:Ribosomal RNA large subunit methyltransferase H n=1 Tax=Paralabilibaculum antarcticum TaxID=2912572 RepID=A0ABT5VY56_9BACT|nr:23S rRNA (pseudouridine(1915)-N(3))-methyltransferase RlmH [Labilibaculum sp. DW002]MDE5420349.1 23S rRNA (pseudouridine(1915)-N(3))-methyltransferase RlmH [Labilibaculum sp. DW002]
MKIILLVIGKTDKDFVKNGIEEYQKRLVHYLPFEINIIPDIKNTKNLSENQQKQKEGALILDKVKAGDHLILLDEGGKEFSSVAFSKFIEQKMIGGTKKLVFVIGGPYGFSDDVYRKAQGKVSLSKMTFSHQMIRMIFTEQLYRAMTIIKGEPYHHV